MLGFRAPNQCRGGRGHPAGRARVARVLIRKHHQRSAARQDVNGLPQARLGSWPFILIKDHTQMASKESGERAAGETFGEQTMNRALNRQGQRQRLQKACRVAYGEQGRAFRGNITGMQQADFSPREREPPTDQPVVKPVAWWIPGPFSMG